MGELRSWRGETLQLRNNNFGGVDMVISGNVRRVPG